MKNRRLKTMRERERRLRRCVRHLLRRGADPFEVNVILGASRELWRFFDRLSAIQAGKSFDGQLKAFYAPMVDRILRDRTVKWWK